MSCRSPPPARRPCTWPSSGAVQARQSAARGPGHLVASAVEHSRVLNAADWLARVTRARVSITGVDSLGPGRPRRVQCRDAAEPHPARLPAVRQSRGRHAAAGGGGGGRVPRYRTFPSSSMPAATAGRMPVPRGLVAAGRQRAQMGRPGRRRRAGGPPGVRWREPFPADDRENRRVPGFPNVPAVLAAAASLTAMGQERGRRRRRAARPDRPDPGGRPGTRSGLGRAR